MIEPAAKFTTIRGFQRVLGGEDAVSQWTIRRAIKADKIKIIRVNSRILIPLSEVERIEREGI